MEVIISVRHTKLLRSDFHYHVVARQKLLKELGLFVLDSFDDEFVVDGDVEDAATGPGIRKFSQWLVAEW